MITQENIPYTADEIKAMVKTCEKYNEALERASKLKVQNPFDTVGQMVEHIFPELKESEDERKRKAILTGLIDCRDAPDLGWSNFGGINIDECISWLEKQGEKVTNINGEDYGIDGLYHAIRILEKTVGRVTGYQSDDGILEHRAAINAIKELYEKQGENKPTDEVEPKFKVGNKVIFTNGNVEKIVSVGTHGYTFENGDWFTHEFVEKDARLYKD